MEMDRQLIRSLQSEVIDLRKKLETILLQQQQFASNNDNKLNVNNNDKEDLSKKFIDKVALMGVVDALKSKHIGTKIIWGVIFIFSLSMATYFVFQTFAEYLSRPTATKVTIVRNSTYEFPIMYLCSDAWFDMTKARELNLSSRALRFSLGYLLRYEDMIHAKGTWSESNESMLAEQEFLDFYEENKFSTAFDYFLSLSTELTVDEENAAYNQVFVKAYGCDTPKPTVLDRGVCYKIALQPERRKLRGSEGLPYVQLRIPDLTEGVIEVRPYWRLYAYGQSEHINPITPFVSIYEGQTMAVTVFSHRMKMLNTRSHQCFDRETVRQRNYSTVNCLFDCVSAALRRRLGCTLLSMSINASLPIGAYCNPISLSNMSNVTTEWDQQHTSKCVEDCPDECETWMHSVSVDSHANVKALSEMQSWSTQYGFNYTAAKIYFINAALLNGGTLEYEEVFTYSFETLIGNIGGTCGIWIGVGVITLIQLIIFVIQHVFYRAFRSGRPNVVRIIKERTPWTTSKI